MLDYQRCLFNTCCQPAPCLWVFFFLLSLRPYGVEEKKCMYASKALLFRVYVLLLVFAFLVFILFISLSFSLFFLCMLVHFWYSNSVACYLILLAIDFFGCVFLVVAVTFGFFSLSLLLGFHFSKQSSCYNFFCPDIRASKYWFPAMLCDTRVSINMYAILCLSNSVQRLRAIMLCSV